MDENTVLDFVELQLDSASPVSSGRCELFISAGGEREKLACGFIKTFLSHVRAALGLEVTGVVRLDGPEVFSGARRPWFTKGTLERFVQFVSNPEVLERVKTLEDELAQLEQVRCMQAKSFRQEDDAAMDVHATVSRAGKFQYNAVSCVADESKRELLRAMEVRLAALQQEQDTAFARAAAAGFDDDSIEDLLAFSKFFGAERLWAACHWFVELSKNGQRASLKPLHCGPGEAANFRKPVANEAAGTDLPLGPSHVRTRDLEVTDHMNDSPTREKLNKSAGISPIRASHLHGQGSKGLPQRASSPRRRAVSPLKKVQVGRFGSKRPGSLVVRSINYARHDRMSKEKYDLMETSSSDCEDDFNGAIADGPVHGAIPPAVARRLSVQAAIDLFESKQSREVNESQSNQSSTKKDSRRASLEGSSTSSCLTVDSRQYGAMDSFEVNTLGLSEKTLAQGFLNDSRAWMEQIGLKSPCRRQDPSPCSISTGISSESDTSNARGTLANSCGDGLLAEKSSVSDIESRVHQDIPISPNTGTHNHSYGQRCQYSLLQKGPSHYSGGDGGVDSTSDCIELSDVSTQALTSMANWSAVSDEVSSGKEGRLYEHYRKLRDARMRKEQQSKRAEREAKLRLMEETLDLRKAEMDAQTAQLHRDSSHARSRVAKLLALKSNLGDMPMLQDESVFGSLDTNLERTLKDRTFSDSSIPSPPRTPTAAKEQVLTPKTHKVKRAAPTSQKSSTTPQSSMRVASLSPRSTPRGAAAKASPASTVVTDNPLACSIACFSDMKKEKPRLSPGKPLGSNRAQTKLVGKSEAPVVTKVRRSTIAPINQEARPFLRKGAGIGPGAGPGVVMKMKADSTLKSSDEDAPATPQKNSDEETPTAARNISEASDGDTMASEYVVSKSAPCLSSQTSGSLDGEAQTMAMPTDGTDGGGLFSVCGRMNLGSPSKDEGFADNEIVGRTVSLPIDNVMHDRYVASHVSEHGSVSPQPSIGEISKQGGEVSATLSELLWEGASQVSQMETCANGSASFRAAQHLDECNVHSVSPLKPTSLASSSLKRFGATMPNHSSPFSAAIVVESPLDSPASWNSSQVQYASETDVARPLKKWGSSEKPVVMVIPPKEPAKGLRRLLKFGRKNRASAPEVFIADGVSASTNSEGDDDLDEVTRTNSAQNLLRKAKLQERVLKDFGDGFLCGDHGNAGLGQSSQSSFPGFKLKHDNMPGISRPKASRSFFSLSNFRSRGREGK